MIMAATATMTTTAMATIWGCDNSNGGNKEGDDSNDVCDNDSDDNGKNVDDYGSDSDDVDDSGDGNDLEMRQQQRR